MMRYGVGLQFANVDVPESGTAFIVSFQWSYVLHNVTKLQTTPNIPRFTFTPPG